MYQYIISFTYVDNISNIAEYINNVRNNIKEKILKETIIAEELDYNNRFNLKLDTKTFKSNNNNYILAWELKFNTIDDLIELQKILLLTIFEKQYTLKISRFIQSFTFGTSPFTFGTFGTFSTFDTNKHKSISSGSIQNSINDVNAQKNINQKIDQNINQNIDQNINQNINQNIEQTTQKDDKKFLCKYNCDLSFDDYINNKSLELADFGYEMSKWKTLVNPEIEKLEKNVEQISKKRKLE